MSKPQTRDDITTPATTTDDSPQPLKHAHFESVVAAADDSYADNTKIAYHSAWARFVNWCEEEGYDSLPAAPQTVAAFFTSRAEAGRSTSTLSLDRAAIRHFHLEQGYANPAASPGVARVLRGLRRRAAKSPTNRGRGQVTGLTAEHLAAIRATAKLQRTGPTGKIEAEKSALRRGAVDVALISTMRDALLRRSEAVDLRWRDIEFRRDGTGRVTIRRSKTDQEAEGAVLFISAPTVRDLEAIRGDAAESDRVFGLTNGRSIANRIKAAAKAAGLQGTFSGHSPRVGFAMDLAAAGFSTTQLQIVGRWASARMPSHYARSETAGRSCVALYYGADDRGS